MKYSYAVIASIFALAGVAQAASDSAASSEETEFKLECIEVAIADELPDDQMDAFVVQCVGEKLAARKKLQPAGESNS